jgi:arylsulfatase A-like enzyme
VRLSLRTVRARDAKLTVDLLSGAGELYDLGSDPHELHNLWDAPEAAGLKAQLLAMADQRPDDMRPEAVPVGIA